MMMITDAELDKRLNEIGKQLDDRHRHRMKQLLIRYPDMSAERAYEMTATTGNDSAQKSNT